MKKSFILLAAIIISSISFAKAQTNDDDTKAGLILSYGYKNTVGFEVTQKDAKGLALGFGASKVLDKRNISTFAVVGHTIKGFEVHARAGIISKSKNNEITTLYGGTILLPTRKKVTYLLGYDNFNKFQSGIGLLF